MSLHLEPKTAVLLQTLAAGGAEVVATGNFGSTQDDVVAALRADGMTVFGTRADDWDTHLGNVAAVIDAGPDILLDNGADLAAGAIDRKITSDIIGGTEETTSGGFRLREDFAPQLPFPIIVINDSLLKAIGENRHAVGQSVVESLMRLTNLMVNASHAVVLGYGWCGRGIAQYLRALGAQVAVAEIDPIKAFEAALDGFRVAELNTLAPWADLVITATGRAGVVDADTAATMRPGTVLANAGHFPTEIDVTGLRAAATATTPMADSIEKLDYPGDHHLILLAGGRMVNLAGRDPKGNSLESMDLGFLLQTLSLERVATAPQTLTPGPQPVPLDIEQKIARRFVRARDAAR